MSMWVLRDTNNWPTNNMAKLRIGKSNDLLRNVSFGGMGYESAYFFWVKRTLTVDRGDVMEMKADSQLALKAWSHIIPLTAMIMNEVGSEVRWCRGL